MKKLITPTRLDHSGESPLHHQLYIQIRELIRSRRYGLGQQLPSEVALCKEFGVSRVTVQKAMQRLVAEAFVVRGRGRGTVVTEAGSANGLDELLDNVEAVMASTTGCVLELGRAEAFGDVAQALGVRDGTRVFRAAHLRVRRTQKMGLLWSWMPTQLGRLVTRQEAVRTPAVVILRRAGKIIGTVDQIIRAAVADVEAGEKLNVPAGFPLLRLERTVYDDHDAPLEYLVALYRADHYAVRMSLAPSKDGQEHWSVHRFE